MSSAADQAGSPAVSIVLPVHNGARYLAGSIDSCRAQSFADWELIVVDDASTDATPEIVQQAVAKDPRIRSIRNETNLKLPASLNAGFALARGRFFSWTSDDNRYLPGAIEAMVRALESSPEIAIVYCDYEIIDARGAVVRAERLEGPEHLAYGNMIRACFLYRREVHEALGGYRTDLYTAEDYDFWLRASLRFRYRHLAEPLYQFRKHEASLTARLPREIALATETTLRENLPKMGWLPRAFRARGWTRLAALALARRDGRQARADLSRVMGCSMGAALRHTPWDVWLGALAGPRIMEWVVRRVRHPTA